MLYLPFNGPVRGFRRFYVFYMGEGKLGLKRLVYDVLNPGGSFKTHVTFEHEQKNRQEVYCIVEQQRRKCSGDVF